MDSTLPLAFSTMLRRYRRAAGLTQEAIAARAGVSARNISNLERGVNRAPHQDTVALLAEALALSSAERRVFASAAARLGQSTAGGALTEDGSPAGERGVPFVGRRREVALLEQHLAGEGPPVLLVAGGPGIGKTRLVQAAIPRAVTQGWRVLAGGCQRREGQEPYAPLLGALQRYLRNRRPAELRRDLQGCAWLVRLLPELADGPIPPLPAWTVAPTQERRLMVDAVVRLLRNVAGPAGTLLLLDDLQWAGADALDLLVALARAAGEIPLRVVGAYRDTEVQGHDALHDVRADLATAGLAAQERLGPLAPEDAAQLLAALLAAHGAGDEVPRERVLERAAGVPFFVVSWAQALRTSADAGRVADAVPWTVEQSIHQRMAALPEAAQALLGVAAVVGRTVPSAVLVRVAAQAEEVVLDAMEATCGAQLMADGAEGTDTYRFVHDVVREVIEARLSRTRRTLLHRRVAEALLALSARPPVEDVAYHYARAGEHDAAALWLERAGDEARSAAASAAALEHYTAARLHLVAGSAPRDTLAGLDEKIGDLAWLRVRYAQALEAFAQARSGEAQGLRRARLWCKEGHVRTLQGDFAGALAAFDAAEDDGLSAETGPVSPVARAEVEGGRAWAHYLRGSFGAATEGAERALALLSAEALSAPADAVRAEAIWTLACVAASQGDFGRQADYSRQMLAICERTGDLQGIGRARMGQGITAWYGGWLIEAETHLWAGLELLQRIGDEQYISGSYWALGAVAFHRGDVEHAAEYFGRLYTIAEQGGGPHGQALARECLGKVAHSRGNLAQAEDYYRQGLAIAEQVGSQITIAIAALALAAVADDRGDRRTATHWARYARRIARRNDNQRAETEALAAQARVWLHESPSRPRLRAAATFLARARTLAETHGLAEFVIPITLLWALLCLAREQPAAAAAEAMQALHQAREYGWRQEEARAKRLVGQIAAARGAYAEATEHLRSALALQTEMGTPLEAARTALVLADVMAAGVGGTTMPQEARQLHAQAEAQFTASGAMQDRARGTQFVTAGARL